MRAYIQEEGFYVSSRLTYTSPPFEASYAFSNGVLPSTFVRQPKTMTVAYAALKVS